MAMTDQGRASGAGDAVNGAVAVGSNAPPGHLPAIAYDDVTCPPGGGNNHETTAGQTDDDPPHSPGASAPLSGPGAEQTARPGPADGRP